MEECHAKIVSEKISQKKAGGNVEKLEQLVDQLKGQIDPKDRVKHNFSMFFFYFSPIN